MAIPLRSVLLLEQQKSARTIDARSEPRGMQMHEREQREGLRHCADGMFGQQRRQPHRLITEFVADRVVSMHREVSFVEKEIQHRVNTGQP